MLVLVFFALLQLVLTLPVPLPQQDLAVTKPRAPIVAPLSPSLIPIVARPRSADEALLPRKEEASLYTPLPLENRTPLDNIESREDYCSGDACNSPSWNA